MILLVAGLLLKINILWTIGVILLIVGGILYLLGALDRPVLGRRHFY